MRRIPAEAWEYLGYALLGLGLIVTVALFD
jgi:hypothetical protein